MNLANDKYTIRNKLGEFKLKLVVYTKNFLDIAILKIDQRQSPLIESLKPFKLSPFKQTKGDKVYTAGFGFFPKNWFENTSPSISVIKSRFNIYKQIIYI